MTETLSTIFIKPGQQAAEPHLCIEQIAREAAIGSPYIAGIIERAIRRFAQQAEYWVADSIGELRLGNPMGDHRDTKSLMLSRVQGELLACCHPIPAASTAADDAHFEQDHRDAQTGRWDPDAIRSVPDAAQDEPTPRVA